MTVIALGICRDGWVTRDAKWTDPRDGKVVMGVSRLPCEECGGKGCPKPAAKADAS